MIGCLTFLNSTANVSSTCCSTPMVLILMSGSLGSTPYRRVGGLRYTLREANRSLSFRADWR